MKKLVVLSMSTFCSVPLACSKEPANRDDPVAAGQGGASGGAAGDSDIVGGRPSGGGDGSGGRVAALSPMVVCTIGSQLTRARTGGSTLLEDFDEEEPRHLGNGTDGYWYGIDDGTSGTQVPSSPHTDDLEAPPVTTFSEPGGVIEDGGALHVVGGGFRDWGSAQGTLFASVDNDVNSLCLFDASIYDGISLWIRGEVRRQSDGSAGVIKMHLAEVDVYPLENRGRCDAANGSCWDAHEVVIEPTECWRRVSFTFEEFEQEGWGSPAGALDLDELVHLDLQVAQGHSFDYYVDEISFFVGEPPEPREMCDDLGDGGAGGGPPSP